MILRLDDATAEALLRTLLSTDIPELVALRKAITLELARCKMWFEPGVLVPPGAKSLQRSRCALATGHEGEHKFEAS